MASRPVVVKLGGDALASPERIVAAARRVASRAAAGPVVVVVSARRGVTDHLLGLVEEVRSAMGGVALGVEEADRAVAAGEVVAASLLALALRSAGVAALSLDAREAGLKSSGASGEAHIRGVAAGRLKRLLAEGVTPVVTGFQGWSGERVVTLGRGGSDVTAVSVGIALQADRVEFVKDAAGLQSADPKLIPDARLIPEAPHRLLTALARAGARIIHPEAARLAERRGVPLEFFALDSEKSLTRVSGSPAARELRVVATAASDGSNVRITALSSEPLADSAGEAERLRRCLAQGSIDLIAARPGVDGVQLTLQAEFAAAATRSVHDVFVLQFTGAGQVRRAS